MKTCSKLKRGRGLFLFADKTILDQPENILEAGWQAGQSGTLETLLH